ncbi:MULTISPECIES: MerR family transcriptional regulator [unclassified Apibacter]|uniref:MerR family transcriptional regulator n=1 Tax=unclassified Apibacter TaxID=2630820 RepID=UPI001324229E|nr:MULTISPECIES: MerR family transcriptional regulator [unclassified Apibacter]MCX8677211.1 MerR family transcriptional regulator [Apibacter sp. B3919]MXO24409.1 MerR family transcriptional regulator [Apibacter sp. B3924]MXO25653.1 MerR family transcriptional regulator [Apibacter sp. B3813]MXO27604.1 MerR family transcriptional regulator [Apibacter sp. B3913]MXO30036.1 MerR family transcriptional regulator [Apibacter sp. B3912]
MNVQLPEKLYYSIGEVAQAFNVNTSLIRFWEKEFDSISPKKNKKGDRFFTPKDIENLKIIFYLVKEKGYTLEGAKVVLQSQKNLSKKVEIIARLELVKTELIKLKELLDE